MEKSIIDRFFSRTAVKVAKHLCNICGEETYKNGAGESICLCCDALEAECTCKEKMAAKNEKQAALIPGKYIVTGQAYNRKSGRVVGPMRDEVIDTRTNELFKDVTSLSDIEAAYESFWNDLNPDSEEIVKVFSVKPTADQEVSQTTDKQTAYARANADYRRVVPTINYDIIKERLAERGVVGNEAIEWMDTLSEGITAAREDTESAWKLLIDMMESKQKSDKFKGNGKSDKQTAYAERLRARVDAEATTFDKENWSNVSAKPGGIYRSASKEAKMNIIGIATDLWDRGIIGDNKLQALKSCKNEKIVQAEVLRIARANKLTDIVERIGGKEEVASNLDGQVETKDDKGYPRATGPSKTPADAGGTKDRLPGNAEPGKSPASHDGTENRLPGIREPKKEPWTGWKQKYDLKEEELADSPTPASTGGTDKRLPGVSEPEYHPKGGYPGTHTAQQEPLIRFTLTDVIEALEEFRQNSIGKAPGDLEAKGFDKALDIIKQHRKTEVESIPTPKEDEAADRARRSVKAQHRTPQELMKEQRKKESQIEGMPHTVKIDPTKQENLGEPETQIKKQVHTTGNDMVASPVTGDPESMINSDKPKDGESNPEVGIADVKNDYAPLGHPEGSTLQKSIEGMFTYPPDTEGAESKKKGQVGAGETSLVVEDFSLPGDSETKINWDLPKGERNEAPKTISADPTMTEQKSTSIPRENTFKGETNQKPGEKELKEQIASKDSIEVTCEQCHTAMTLTGEEFKEWADMGKTMCKCGNLVSVDLSDTSLSEDLFTSPAVSEDKARDLTGKKKKAKKGQVHWERVDSKVKEESVMDRFIAGKEMGREAQVITGDESGYGAKPDKKDETLEHDYDKDYREKMLDENKEDKTQDEREKELKKAFHNIQVGDRVWMKEHEGTVLFRVDEIELGLTPGESTAYINELETGRYGQWIDLEDLVPAFPENKIGSKKKADCGHCGNPGTDEPCDGEQCPYCAKYIGEDASEELHDMSEVECPHCRKVLEASKKESQVTDPNAVCGNLWYNGTDEQRSSFKGGTQGRGKDEKPPKEWFDDCLSKVGRTAQKAPKLYDSQGKQLVAFRGEGGWTLKAVQGSIYKRGTYQEIENFVDKKIEQGEFSTSKKAQKKEERSIVKKVDDYLGERIEYWKSKSKNEDEILERAENETMGKFGLSYEVYQYLRSQTPDRAARKAQLSETDPMQMETGKPTSEIEKIQMGRERVDKPIDVIMTPSIERSEGAGSPIDPTFMAEQIVRGLKNNHYHAAQEGFNHMIRSTKDITSEQVEELKGLMTELGYDVTEQKGVEGIS